MIASAYIVPRGTPRCAGCSHDAHAPGQPCNAIAHFTRKRCQCPGHFAATTSTPAPDATKGVLA